MKFAFPSFFILISLFFLPSVAWGTASAPVITKATTNLGLLSYWAFNEGTGTSASDFSGVGNIGTLVNGPIWGVGRLGKSVVFDGSNDEVTAGTSDTIFTENGAMTISAWIYPVSTGENGEGRIIDRSGTTNGPFLSLSANNRVLFKIDGTTDLVRETNDNIFNLNKWNHVLITWDGNNTASNVRIYVNGAEASYATTTNGSSLGDNVGTTLRIGNDASGARTFEGSIDEVRLYSRELSPSEVLKLFRSSAVFKKAGSSSVVKVNTTMKNIVPSGLIGFWPFDGKHTLWSTNQTSDLSGNGHTANMIGMSAGRTPAIGKVGQGLLFDGIDDNVNPLDSNDFNINLDSKYTWSMWLKPSAFGDRLNTWAQYDNSGVNFFVISAHTTSEADYGPVTRGVTAAWANTAGNNYLMAHTNNNVLEVGRWNHVTITYDGALSPSNRFTIYIDGVDQTDTADVFSSGNISSIVPDILSIGGEPGGQHNGTIDEVRFYNRKLTTKEIYTIFCNCARP